MKNLRKIILSLTVLTMLVAVAETKAQHRDRPADRRGKPVVVARTYHPVVARRAAVRYSGLPRWGATVTVAPVGALAVKYRNNPYYAHNGVYYAQRQGGYSIVRPVRGLRVGVLPVGYRTIAMGPRSYYYYYGTYYQPGPNNSYTVVDPPVGAVVDSLPDGATVSTVNGVEYYNLEGVTYAEVDAPEYEDGIGYQVVSVS